MFEYLIYTGLPVFIGLFALQSRFFHNWRFLLVSVLAIYSGLWSYPILNDLLRAFYPRELLPYSTVATSGAAIFAGLMVFWGIGVKLSSHSGGGYHLPKSRSFPVLLPAALTGLLYSGLIGYLISISPLHCKLAKTESFSRKAVRRMQVFTCIVDCLSLQPVSPGRRKAALEKRLYPLIDPVKAAAEKAAKIRAGKEAAIKKAAEEKAAAEKAAAEKARLEALKKKHRSGKVGDKFMPGQFGGSVRDSHSAEFETAGKSTEKTADLSAQDLKVVSTSADSGKTDSGKK